MAFERFTHESRSAVGIANREALRRGEEEITPALMLLGLARSRSGIAQAVLRDAGFDCDLIATTLEEKLAAAEHDTKGKLPMNDAAKGVIWASIEEARALDHRWIGTGHLLLGLLGEHGEVARDVLEDLGLELDAARRLVHVLINLEGEHETAP